jgi:hypothetical protein
LGEEMKYIGIVGSRRRNETSDQIKVHHAFLKEREEGDIIVSGGCWKGGDKFAEIIAKHSRTPILIYYANWNLGKHAGFLRNTDIAKKSDVLIACVAEDRTGGTEDTIKKFKKFHPDGKVILV